MILGDAPAPAYLEKHLAVLLAPPDRLVLLLLPEFPAVLLDDHLPQPLGRDVQLPLLQLPVVLEAVIL